MNRIYNRNSDIIRQSRLKLFYFAIIYINCALYKIIIGS